MAKLLHLVAFLNIAGIVLASPGILQSQTLITRNEKRGQPAGSPTTDGERPQPSDSPTVTTSSAQTSVSHDSTSVSSGDLEALNVLESALSTFSTSTTFSTARTPDPADFTTQISSSFGAAQNRKVAYTAPTSATTVTVTATNAWATTSRPATSAYPTHYTSTTSSLQPASSVASSKPAFPTSWNVSQAPPKATSSTSSSAGKFSTMTTVVPITEPSSLATSQGYTTIVPATIIQLVASQSPTTTAVQCAHDHVKHVDNGGYVQQEQVSCGADVATSTAGLWDAVSTSSEALTSNTPTPTSSSESLPIGIQEALAWLTQTTGTFSSERTHTPLAMVEATHTSAAGADRVGFKLW